MNYLQEQCLSENQFAEEEENKSITNIESFGEDYGKFLRIVEKNSSDESFCEFARNKKRRLRKVICIATHDKKEGGEDDLLRKFLTLVHKFNLLSEELNALSGTIDNSFLKHPQKAKIPTISLASSKSVISKQRAVQTKSRVRTRSHLHLLSSCLVFCVLSVSWLCHPQCCDFYQDWQLWPIFSYRDGPPPI